MKNNDVYNKYQSPPIASSDVLGGSAKKVTNYEEGKAFFKEARRILSFEKFSYFMQQIKLLNKKQRTKEELVKVAEGLFTKEYENMVEAFKQLISYGNTSF